jgi:hypothetical protein
MIQEKLLTLIILLVLAGCDSTRTLYQSAGPKTSSWTVNAYTMSHCGCTQLFVEKYRNGRNEFQIMYTDDFARKSIYSFDHKGAISDTVVLVARADSFDIPFDSLDNEIFERLKTIVGQNDGLVYPMKWTEYKGYVKKER